MGSPKSKTGHFNVVRFDSVDELLRVVIGLGHFDSNPPKLVFRGAGDLRFGLVPGAWRAGEFQKSPEAQKAKELDEISNFAIGADAIGHRLPDGMSVSSILHYCNGERFYHEMLPTIGLAQHYGVRTRLIDFTHDRLVALYFAALSAMHAYSSDTRAELVVWVADVNCLHSATIESPAPPSSSSNLSLVQISYAGNENLRAQKGVFLMPRFTDTDEWWTGEDYLNRDLSKGTIDPAQSHSNYNYNLALAAPAYGYKLIFQTLEDRFGIHNHSIFPELSGVAADRKWHKSQTAAIEVPDDLAGRLRIEADIRGCRVEDVLRALLELLPTKPRPEPPVVHNLIDAAETLKNYPRNYELPDLDAVKRRFGLNSPDSGKEFTPPRWKRSR